ncbi:MAG: polysaccharide biosynthesis protein [Deltaproteobacteria bacterium]|nr:polysaccharide biosynthesis protein [Deltaproteobacteria bacterium]
MRNSLESFILRFRLPLIIALQALTTFAGYLLALCLRFDFHWTEVLPFNRLVFPALLLFTARHAAYTYLKLYRGYWRYASTQDLIDIIKAHFVSSLCFTAMVLLLRIHAFPRSVIFIEFAVSILLSGGSRLFTRLICERFIDVAEFEASGDVRQVIVIGAGDSGHLLVKNMLGHKRLSYEPVAILDDSERLLGGSVFGVPVWGTVAMLEECLEHFPHVSAVIVAIPSLSPQRAKQIEAICKSIGVAVKRLQAFEDLACIDASIRQEAITIEAVLEKQISVAHEEEISRQLCGQMVLVTGAGGSIGSELVRQILEFKPASIILLDNSEFNLFKLCRELNGNHPDVRRIPILGTIKDRNRLARIFKQYRPQVVFHAAAYKHVPLMEENCYEAFLNNIVGTRNVLEVAAQFAVQRFVLISSDKAVAPSSVMGCSKLIAELLTQHYCAHQAPANVQPPMSTAVVRFGNVINSTGSVIPVFKEQILSGGPVTVTHPDMERYFMSIREAVRLVLTAGTLGERGEIYILDMGKPIKIVDVAKKMLALYGRRDIEIVYTGTRPGEKLSEELLSSSEYRGPTRFQKVSRVENFLQPQVDVLRWVAEVEKRLPNLSDTEIKNLMFALVEHAPAVISEKQQVASL